MPPENDVVLPPTAERVNRELSRWFDHTELSARPKETQVPREAAARHVDWVRVAPFLGMHAACLAVIWVGFSWVALTVTLALYGLRMFAITGFYHRYFSHRTFKTSRADSSSSACSAPRRSSVDRSGGLLITAIIMCTPTRPRTYIPRCSMDSFGATWAGSCPTSISRPTFRG